MKLKNIMKCRVLSITELPQASITVLLCISLTANGQQSAPQQKAKDKLSVATSVEVNGYVGGKFDASYNNRILAQDVKRLV